MSRWVIHKLLIGLVILIVVGGMIVYQKGYVTADNATTTQTVHSYSITLLGNCLPGGSLNIEVTDAQKTISKSGIQLFDHLEPINQSYTINGEAMVNGESSRFVEKDFWLSSQHGPVHQQQWIIDINGHHLTQNFRFEDGVKVAIGQASC